MAFPNRKIYVLLKKDYVKGLVKNSIRKLNCKNYYGLSVWINKNFKTKINGGDINYWIMGERLDIRTNKIHPKFVPLWLILELLKLNNKKVEGLNNNILSYRSGGSGLRINKPRLPILVTPELDSVVIHIMADGAGGNFTPSYTQKNKEQVKIFTEKLRNCFGEFESSFYFTQDKYQVKFPKAITDILSSYYSIKSYMSYDAVIPPKIINRKNNEHKLACLIAFIVDEGGIRDVISLYSSNKPLLINIKTLIKDCGYKSSEIKFNDKAKSFIFSLSNYDVERFYNDVKKLCKKYYTCNLSFKEGDVKFIIEMRSKKKPKNKEVTDNLILERLKEGELSARQISRALGYAYCTIIHHLEDLRERRIVSARKVENKTYLWNC